MILEHQNTVLAEPQRTLRRRGLGATDVTYPSNPFNPTVTVDPSTITAGGDPNAPTNWNSIVTGIDSGLLQLTNLVRTTQGQQPISAASVAPQVNVGISKDTMIFAGIGILALLLVLRKR